MLKRTPRRLTTWYSPGLCHLKDVQLSRQGAVIKSAQPRCRGNDFSWEVEGTFVE